MVIHLTTVPSSGAKIEAKEELAPKPRYILGLEELGGYEFKQDTILEKESNSNVGFLSGLPGFWGWAFLSAFVDRLDVIVNEEFPEVLDDYAS